MRDLHLSINEFGDHAKKQTKLLKARAIHCFIYSFIIVYLFRYFALKQHFRYCECLEEVKDYHLTI